MDIITKYNIANGDNDNNSTIFLYYLWYHKVYCYNYHFIIKKFQNLISEFEEPGEVLHFHRNLSSFI